MRGVGAQVSNLVMLDKSSVTAIGNSFIDSRGVSRPARPSSATGMRRTAVLLASIWLRKLWLGFPGPERRSKFLP